MQIINLQLDGQNLLGVAWSTPLMGFLQRSGGGRGKCPKHFMYHFILLALRVLQIVLFSKEERRF